MHPTSPASPAAAEPRGAVYLCGCFTAIIMLFCFHISGSLAATPSYLPYPSADSSIINPYEAGDETALLLAALQSYYRQATGKTLHISTIAGRGGASGWGALASQPGDGYHIAVTNLQNVILRSMSRRPVFQLGEIYNFCVMAQAPLVLWVPENSPFHALPELVASARAYPEKLIIAGTGSMTINHLATLQFGFLSGSKNIYLPYLGTGTAMQAASIGQAHAAWGFPLPDFGRQMRMRPLAVSAAERLANMAEVPTFDELGIGLFAGCHFGLAMPAATQTGTRQEVATVFQGIIDRPEFQSSLKALGFTPMPIGMREMNQLMTSEAAKYGELLNDYSME